MTSPDGPSPLSSARSQQIEQLLDDLARPTFVWRSARGLFNGKRTSGWQLRGAAKRHARALREIDDLISAYVARRDGFV